MILEKVEVITGIWYKQGFSMLQGRMFSALKHQSPYDL
ncbi:hypothetical protein BSG1_03250 [Bacillus sp. SG-1]|nr:hypothetical protein BSG1_03250 [Bacillus sp. SG-1]